MRPTLVIADRQGRLCNRLWVFSNVAAFAAEHGCRVWNPAFGEYARYFEATARDGLCRWPAGAFPLRAGWFRRVLYVLLRVWRRSFGRSGAAWLRVAPGQELRLDEAANAPVAERLTRQRVTFLEGWGIRDTAAVAGQAGMLRAFFTPVAAHRANVEKLLGPLRARGGALIGVHIRRSDYRTVLPEWFFELDVYLRLMQWLRQRLAGDGEVRFLVSSDEPQQRATFGDLDVSFCRGHELEDLYSLAGCDRIVGPRSTYSAWAAFVGRRPLYHIRYAGHQPELDDFRDNPYL
jgi:hypothetical protein